MNPPAMIVAPQPEAAEAGARVLRRGGNAVDAALACALTQTVVDPLMCGLAGFGSLQIVDGRTGRHVCIDAHARCPASSDPAMWQEAVVGETDDKFGYVLRGHVNELGHGAVAVPGILKAFVEAAEFFGTWDWRDLVEPAIEAARRGVVVRPYLHASWIDEKRAGRLMYADKLAFSATGRRVYFDADGGLLRPGDRIDNPDMLRSLERIAADPAEFWAGAMAEDIAADMQANGGRVTAADLAAYRTVHAEPLRATYRDRLVATNPPPGGGLLVIEMLNVLERFDLAAMGHNAPAHLRLLAEVMKKAAADRDAHVSDPMFVDVPVARLAGKAYARETAEAIAAGARFSVPRLGTSEPRDTTHVSCVDGRGGAVSMTHSLGVPSGAITEGLGFMYNGCMSVFDPRPGRTGSIAPGKSRFASMAPTIVFRDGAPEIVLGAPGGTHITGAVVQAIANVVDFGMTMADAVAAPRVSATSDRLDVSNRIPRYVTELLEAAGYAVRRSHANYVFAAVHGIRCGPGGRLDGGADPQRDGVALAVPGDGADVWPEVRAYLRPAGASDDVGERSRP